MALSFDLINFYVKKGCGIALLKKKQEIASLRDRHTLSMPYVVSLWRLVPPGRISYQKGEETVWALWRLVPSRTTGANLVLKG